MSDLLFPYAATGAEPILAAHGLPATLFLTPGTVSDEREYWWDELEREHARLMEDNGVKLDELYQPYWVEGPLQVKASTSELADAGYQMAADKIYVYELPE